MDASKQNTWLDRKKLQDWAITTVLYLITIALGLVAFIGIPDIARLLIALTAAQNADINTVQARGMVSTARNVSTMCAGLGLMVVSVGGMEYHFRNRGKRKSYRIFAWTIGIEIAIIVLHQIVLRVLIT
jgi:hypothetical protein